MDKEYIIKLKQGAENGFYVHEGYLKADKMYRATISIKDNEDDFIEFVIDEDESECGCQVWVTNKEVDIVTSVDKDMLTQSSIDIEAIDRYINSTYNCWISNEAKDILQRSEEQYKATTSVNDYEFVEVTRKLKNGRYGPVTIHDNSIMLDIDADYNTLNEAANILEQIADFVLEEGDKNYGS